MARLVKVIATLSAFFMSVVAARSQNDSPYIWRYWNVSDGLREEYCAALTLDREGNVWVNHGNSKTVSFLDGFSVRSIQNDDVLIGNVFHTKPDAVWAFAIDQNYKDIQRLRIGLQRFMNGGSERFILPLIQNNSATFHESDRFLETEKNEYFHLNVWKHLPLDSSNVLVVLPDAVYWFNADTEVMQPVLTPDNSGVGEFHEIVQGDGSTAWIGTGHGAVKLQWELHENGFRFLHEAFPFPAEWSLQSARHLFIQGENNLYAAALSKQNGKMVPVKLDGTTWSLIQIPQQEEPVQSVWRVSPNSQFMLTYDPNHYHLNHLLTHSGTNLSTHELPYKLRITKAFKPQLEPNGNVWLNLHLSGVARGALKLWRKHPSFESDNTHVNTFEPFEDGGMAVVFTVRLVTVQNGGYTEHPMPGPVKSFISVLPVNRDELLCVINDGYQRQSTGKVYVYRIPEQAYSVVPVTEGWNAIAIDKHLPDTFLITLRHQEEPSRFTIVSFDGATVSPFLDLGDTGDIGDVYRVTSGASGGVWVCGAFGLRFYTADKTFNEGVSRSFPGKNARFMLEIEDGTVWIGGDNGIFQFDGSGWTNIRSDIVVRVMRMAKDGSIWVLSPDGVHRYKDRSWVMYSETEGLEEIPNYSNLVEDRDGTIWLATSRGIFQYDPNADTDAPKTIIDETRNAKSITPDGNTVIFFEGIDKWKYTPKDRLLYSYKIDRSEWSPFQEVNSAYLKNLSYGQHTFQVRAMDRNWNIDPTPESFSFYVNKPWYIQPGFLFITATLVLIIVFRYVNLESMVRLRTADLRNEIQQRKRLENEVMAVSEREQRRIGQDLHDGLSQLLAGTSMLSQRILNKLESEKHPEADEVKGMQEYLEQSMRFTRDIIRGLTPVAIENRQLDDALREFALNIRKMFGVSCIVDIHCAVEIANSMVKTNVYRIVQEAVNNAIKHGNASLITIKMQRHNQGYRLSVDDNGGGFSSSPALSTGMGLQIMQYRASLFHGSVQVRDDSPYGVDVICEIPNAACTME